jgi:hypothetical protein
LGLVNLQGRGVIRQDMLQQRQGILTTDYEASHVRDIEEPGPPAGFKVFLYDPRPIVKRHMPAAEFDNLCPQGKVSVIEHGLVRCFHVWALS